MPNENKPDPQALKERIGKHLRRADEFTRVQRYEEAILEIDSALKIDPKNNYARSFLERVKLMQKRSQPKESAQTSPTEISLEERMEIISRHLSTAEDFINKRDYKHALEEVSRVYKIDPTNYYAQTYSERIDMLMMEETAGKWEKFSGAEMKNASHGEAPWIATKPNNVIDYNLAYYRNKYGEMAKM